ncbi:hypothetical protein JK218_13340 [Lactiplantibacillus plantarum]|nr:hypothetical protein [Lactiplantibacillus plantarum]
MLERSRRRFELTPNPRHLKYESYSKPEEKHFRLRIIWLLSIVTQPLQSQACEGPRVEAARMADERPPNLAQSIVGYFDTGTSNKVLGALALCREITSYYTNSGLVSYLNITFSLTVD